MLEGQVGVFTPHEVGWQPVCKPRELVEREQRMVNQVMLHERRAACERANECSGVDA
jgi:hypothetical protein